MDPVLRFFLLLAAAVCLGLSALGVKDVRGVWLLETGLLLWLLVALVEAAGALG